jgi:predicted anti-sigma-YlaC factor YlaD
MRVNECEQVQMAIMAQDCSEQPTLSQDEIAAHMDNCNECRQQTEQTRAVDLMLQCQNRREYDVNLWPAIQERISFQSDKGARWQPFAVISLLLLAYKTFEMTAENPPALLFKLVPLILIFGLFVVIRENPFRINSELIMEMKQ